VDKREFKILIAEDDEIVRNVISKFLTDEGYPVVTAKDGLGALDHLRLEDIKLVLSDLRMPGADGMEVLRTAMQLNPRISIVLLTAYGTLDTALEAMKEGAYDYIVKPFVMQQLLLVARNAFKMASLMEENQKLSDQLKEIYGELETLKKSEKTPGENVSGYSIERIEKLEAEEVIDTHEARLLKERLVSAHENIKKYSTLVHDLKIK
jgi:DNA-binding NtrC family response regulator